MSNNKMTMAEVEVEMEYYKKVFDKVHVLQQKDFSKKEDNVFDKNNCPCFSFLGKKNPCDNCLAQRVFESKKDEVRMEFAHDGLYQAIIKYLEIDGLPSALVLLKKFNLESVVDLGNGNKVISHINGYYQKTYFDVLTETYNRRFYEEEVKNENYFAGVAMIDLDDFKVYNDVYGHMAGDAVLTTFASELKKEIRRSDKLIRYGGDEFLLIMPGLQGESFEIELKRILQKVNSISLPGYAEINLTSSIGATLCKNETIESAVNRADMLLYRAKIKKNSIVTDNDGETFGEENKISILIVDDAVINRTILSSILSNEFNVIEADGGEACIDALEKYGSQISLVLLDIMMPDINGFDVLKYMKIHHYLEDIPVITITGDESEQTIRKAYEMGVSDFINRPFDTKVVYRRVLNMINLYEKQRRLSSTISSEILEKEKSSKILVDILSQVTEFRSGMGREHITNINKLTELLLIQLMDKTKKYNLTKQDVYLIATASALHDIGKVEIDNAILNKPGKLTEEEFEKVKMHTVYGAEIVMNIHEYQNEPLVKYAYQICLYHHEKYDGKGYPKGLVGDEIPIAAQVVSLADVFDALTAKRVYKDAYTTEEALQMILNGKCGKFNPLLIECLLDIKKFLVKDSNGELK